MTWMRKHWEWIAMAALLLFWLAGGESLVDWWLGPLMWLMCVLYAVYSLCQTLCQTLDRKARAREERLREIIREEISRR
jgi:hypothetical protein